MFRSSFTQMHALASILHLTPWLHFPWWSNQLALVWGPLETFHFTHNRLQSHRQWDFSPFNLITSSLLGESCTLSTRVSRFRLHRVLFVPTLPSMLDILTLSLDGPSIFLCCWCVLRFFRVTRCAFTREGTGCISGLVSWYYFATIPVPFFFYL